jgi:proline iminopeptidase
MFPPLEPFDSGTLDVGDGHTVYWERCGNPNGVPAVYLHGGPGSGCSPNHRRWFDPDIYHAVLLDQRGAGRSRPLASDPDADLSSNTTAHLISDIECLREHLGIERWIVVGMSWGTTLGLAYAEAHPERVTALLLGLVGTTSRREVDWITRDVGRIFPQQWDRFSRGVPDSMRQLRLVDAYATLLFDPDPEVRDHVAREWCAWEDAHVSLSPTHQPNTRYQDPEFRLRFARLVTHYWRNAAFLDDDELVRNAGTLNGIPGILINGRYDVSGPLETAWRLTESWNTCELQVIDDAGHGDGDAFANAILSALARLARERL